MAVESLVIKCKLRKKIEYPYLGRYTRDDRNIVLFTSKDTGILIDPGTGTDKSNIGGHSKDWSEKSFEVFAGEVTLKNKE